MIYRHFYRKEGKSMLKKLKDIKISIIQIDIIDWLALILSICCLIFCNKADTSFIIPIVVFSILIIYSSICFIIAGIYVRIEYKIKEKAKIPRDYLFKRDISTNDDLFKCHILLIVLMAILILFFVLSIIF